MAVKFKTSVVTSVLVTSFISINRANTDRDSGALQKSTLSESRTAKEKVRPVQYEAHEDFHL